MDGSVVDPAGNPVSGARVIPAGGISGITAADGTFSLANVTTLFDSSASVSMTIVGEFFQGISSLVPPVPHGITEVGQFMIMPFEIDEGGGGPEVPV